MTFLSDPHFWYMLTFCIFLTLFARRFINKITIAIDYRAHEIENQLEKMTRLRQEAMILLSQQKCQQGRMEETIKMLHEDMQNETHRILDTLKETHKNNLRIRAEICDKRLDTMERRMENNIQYRITNITLSATKKYIRKIGKIGQTKILGRRIEHFVKLK